MRSGAPARSIAEDQPLYVFGIGGLDFSDSANSAKDTSSNKLSTFDCFRIAAYLDSVAALAWPPTYTPPTYQPALAASPSHLVVLVPSAADAASLWELIIATQVWKVRSAA